MRNPPKDAHELDLRAGDRPGRYLVAAPRTGRAGAFVRGLLVGLLALVGAGFLAFQVVDLDLDLNPFDAEQTDRSQPPLLQSIQDLSRFVAAEGTFQQVVDLENDREYVPDFLLGDRTLFVATGSVDAYVDFAGLDDGDVVTDPARPGSVTVTLPAPRLDEPELDLDQSYVASQERGVIDRVQDALGDDSTDTGEVYRQASDKIAAAADDTELVARAETNTRSTLRGLLGALGYTDVTVVFEPDPT